MRQKYGEVVTAALAFIQASNRNDEVFVVNFGDRVTSGLPGDVPFTADIQPPAHGPLDGRACADGRLSTTRFSFPCVHLGKGKCGQKDPHVGQRRRRQ